ncbi:DUF2793 domain-containing protein [Amaricoccus macauensis]|uniref:DUF2793 domain-containing protein n=1 Tax=Amaricoccus macauensis TaxID=57001 RepID=UPI003C7AE7DC
MSDETENLKLPYIMPNQAQKHVTHNEAIRVLDALVQLSVASAGASVPPETPDAGARYIVAPGGGGDWQGWDASIAYFVDGFWMRMVPQVGWQAWVQDRSEMRVWSGTAWISISGGSVSGGAAQNLTELGVGTTADAATPFAAKLNAALWTAAGVDEGGDGNLRTTLNKETDSADAGIVFQTGYSSRALMGLMGSDNFSLKVSPDGATFLPALNVSHQNGNIGIGAGADVNNRLLVSGRNSLFTNPGDLNVVMNKGADEDDLSFALQSGHATQALLGLLGGRDFTIKVGADYTTALVIDNATGSVSLPRNASFSATTPDEQSVAENEWTSLVFNNVRHNIGDHYDPVTGAFTAPVDGVYMFGANAVYKEAGPMPNFVKIGLALNGGNPSNDRTTLLGGIEFASLRTSIATMSIVQLGAGDKVQPQIRYIGAGGDVAGTNTGSFYGVIVS